MYNAANNLPWKVSIFSVTDAPPDDVVTLSVLLDAVSGNDDAPTTYLLGALEAVAKPSFGPDFVALPNTGILDQALKLGSRDLRVLREGIYQFINLEVYVMAQSSPDQVGEDSLVAAVMLEDSTLWEVFVMEREVALRIAEAVARDSTLSFRVCIEFAPDLAAIRGEDEIPGEVAHCPHRPPVYRGQFPLPK